MNYARFYALLNEIPTSDRDELKRTLVMQYTGGRTDSVKDMHTDEYESLCRQLERSSVYARKRAIEREQLRQKRSAVLHLMQKLGVNTACWDTVNAFCKQPRIAGKEFRQLDCQELDEVKLRLWAICRKREAREDNTMLS